MPMIRRRRPVLRAAGAAAVGGAAYRAGKRSGEPTDSAPEPGHTYYPPPPEPSSGVGLSSDTIEQLSELGRLHEQGVLTDEEFEEQKRRYLQAS
ncbi:MAG: SHOCT domain-containing protein [Solirubrobacteraceae bacterium]